MKFPLLVLFALVASPALAEDCTASDGTKCNVNHPYSSYFNATPCFKHENYGTVCFFDETNSVKTCDCAIAACNCGLDSSSDGNSSSDGFSSDDSSSDSSSSDDSSSDGSSSDSSSSNGSSSDSTCGIEQTTYCPLGEDNTMCKYCGVDKNNCGTEMVTRGITDDVEKVTIVNKHNELRRKVAKGEETQGSTGSQPPASNMNELVWDDEVAKMAQTWTDQCSSSSHDTNRKMVDRSGGLYCGQNVYNSWTSAGPSSTKALAGAVQAWYDEVKDFDHSAVVSFFSKGGGHTGIVGHYTQVVWGDVSKVGCGYVYRVDAEQNNWYRETVICNYCKGGNMLDGAMYITGEPGSDCPQDHPTANDGLCTAAKIK